MAPGPSAPSGSSNSTLRPTVAAHRYRKGQAPKGYKDVDEEEGDSDEDSNEEQNDEEDIQAAARRKREKAAQLKAAAQATAARRDGLQVINQGQGQQQQARSIKVEVKTDPDALIAAAKVKREESSSGEEESSEEEEEQQRAPSKPVYRAPDSTALPPVKREEEQSSSEEDESSEEEEEVAKPVLYKPVFVSKRVRDLTAPSSGTSSNSGAREANGGGLLDEEAAEMKRQAELEERRRQSTLLAGEAVKRELAGKETEEKFPDVDDTDFPDSDGTAFESWKLRELMRVKREREVDTARSKEREEVEARRALPEALRLKEDTEHAASLRAAKAANRGSVQFLQKYHHKGAFYADDEVLQRYDYSAPTEGEAARGDASALPKVMQVRNYGKMGRTKYTHLVDQDTSDRNAGWSAGLGGAGKGKQGANLLSQGCFHCGGNHMKADCPELRNGAAAGPSGANASALAPRQRRRSRSPNTSLGSRDSYRPSAGSRNDGDRDRSYRREERDDRDRYRSNGRDGDGRDSRRRSRSRSRSRSPRRDRGGDRYRDDDRDDKRRRRDRL